MSDTPQTDKDVIDFYRRTCPLHGDYLSTKPFDAARATPAKDTTALREALERLLAASDHTQHTGRITAALVAETEYARAILATQPSPEPLDVDRG